MFNGSNFYSEEAYNEALDEAQSIPFANESQAAFAASRREACIINQGEQIKALLAEGKSVIAESFIHYCPRTDAVLGASLVIKSVHPTIEAAEAAYAALNPSEYDGGDYAIELHTPQAPAPVTPSAASDDSDVPF